MDETVKWLFGLFAAIGSAVVGHLHIRINRIEEADEKRRVTSDASASSSREKLWTAVNKTSNDFNEFRSHVFQQYITKEDLRGTEARIMEAIRKK